LQQKQSLVDRQEITAKDSQQKPEQIRTKRNRYLFVRRSLQKTHDRGREDSQQKQSLVVRKAITAKDSRHKPQGFAAKAVVSCS